MSGENDYAPFIPKDAGVGNQGMSLPEYRAATPSFRVHLKESEKEANKILVRHHETLNTVQPPPATQLGIRE